jgi:AraC-like DNA-binding protein
MSNSAPPGLQAWQKLRAEEMLRSQLTGNITIKEIATACSLSPSHFARRFRITFGQSVRQYLIRLRLERAKSLLTESRTPLAEVAELTGFCDQAAFTRAFSRTERMTPSRWRKRNNPDTVFSASSAIAPIEA